MDVGMDGRSTVIEAIFDFQSTSLEAEIMAKTVSRTDTQPFFVSFSSHGQKHKNCLDAGLDPLIGKIGKCLGPRALGCPAGPYSGTFKAQFSFVSCLKNKKNEKKRHNLKF